MITTQFHKYDGKPNHAHNCDFATRARESHTRGADEGGYIEVWHDENWKDAIDNRIFGDAISEFNSHQKRKDRMKISYYDECVDREKRDTERNRTKKYNETKSTFRPVHEFVVGVYGTDCSQQEKIQILHEFDEQFQKTYPNLEVVGCYLHVDEQAELVRSGKLTADDVDPHLHYDVVPVAHGFQKGMRDQISLSGALNEMGINPVNKKNNELVQFEIDARDMLNQICREHGLEIAPTTNERKIHYEKEEFIAKQKYAEQKKANVLEQRRNLKLINENENLQIDIEQGKSAITVLEQKCSDMHDEIVSLQEDKDQLQRELSSIIEENKIDDSTIDDLSNGFELALGHAFMLGQEAERKGLKKEELTKFKAESISKAAQVMLTPLSAFKQATKSLKNRISDIIDRYSTNASKIALELTGDIEIYTGRDGKVSEKGKTYIERYIRDNLRTTDNPEWRPVRDYYRSLDSVEKQEKYIHKLVKNAVDFVEDSCSEPTRKYIHRSVLNKNIYASAINITSNLISAVKTVQQMQEEAMDGYER